MMTECQVGGKGEEGEEIDEMKFFYLFSLIFPCFEIENLAKLFIKKGKK
ncbi:MAG: hypothetical protein ACTHKK_09065 [Candidatus Nitrosocosmicus sp.]